mmetsp:Transcript_14990/g.47827  ORF Transcript_14990/g.47827 Transcript_14990/m.47827 type:complete len:207 (+) Transcript_14990:384-1004(+)
MYESHRLRAPERALPLWNALGRPWGAAVAHSAPQPLPPPARLSCPTGRPATTARIAACGESWSCERIGRAEVGPPRPGRPQPACGSAGDGRDRASASLHGALASRMAPPSRPDAVDLQPNPLGTAAPAPPPSRKATVALATSRPLLPFLASHPSHSRSASGLRGGVRRQSCRRGTSPQAWTPVRPQIRAGRCAVAPLHSILSHESS